MLLSNAHNKNRGFTLLETLIIIVIIGILSAIAAPSFLALFNRSKVNDAVNQVRGVLQQCQREAIRKSKSYTLNPTTSTITGSCLVTGAFTPPTGVAMANNISGSIKFSIRGNTTFTVATSPTSNDTTGKIILYQIDGPSSNRKCVAISNGIGIIRSGDYSGSSVLDDVNITSGVCNAKQ